jgi:Tat protein translocase TatC
MCGPLPEIFSMILRPLFEKLFKFRELASRKNKVRAGADEGFDPHEKPFLDHLEDLRHTLMKVIIALVITTILGFAFHEKIFHFVLTPLEMVDMVDKQGNPDGTLADHVRFIVLSPPEILMLSIKVSFFAGLIGAFPLLVYFIGEFVLPGLRQQEKKLVIPGIIAGFFLFILGGSFAFFMATPIAMEFFHKFEKDRISFTQPNVDKDKNYLPIRRSNHEKTFTAKDVVSGGEKALKEGSRPEVGKAGEKTAGPAATPSAATTESAPQLPAEQQEAVLNYLLQLIVVEQGSELSVSYEEDIGKIAISTGIRDKSQYRIGEYISFVTRLVLVFGLSFQLPVVVTILSKLQLLTARVMRNTRAFAWVIMLVLSAIFTPPDVFTLGLLAGPLILLYEICIWIAWSIERNRDKAQQAEEEEERLRLEALYSKPADELSEEEKAELNRREIEQYEREHEHLDDDHYHDDDDHYHQGDGHDDPDHPGIKNDPHSIGYDPHHDESWDGDHDEHGNPYHNDPYHGDGPEHHDPHENTEAHEPIQDWPDREDEDKGEEKSDSDDSESTALESDHAEPSGEPDGDGDTDDGKDSDKVGGDNEPCAPAGAIINPNVATLEELVTLPGVDEELADHMILYRPFNNFDELLEVPGMDNDILNAIIDRLNLE